MQNLEAGREKMQLVWITVTSFIFRLSFVSISPDPLNFCLLFPCTQPKGMSRYSAGDQPLMKISIPAVDIKKLPASAQRCQGQRRLQWLR